MTILVTGGAGFIGGKLIQRLLREGYEVISLDKKPLVIQGVEHITHDISIPIEKLNRKIDVIYHIAAQSGGYYSLGNSYQDCLDNSVGTHNIVKLAQKLQVSKFIYTSSMAVYGNGLNKTEQTLPTPISFYGASKLSGEYYTTLLQEHNKISYTIFRLFATYGPGQDFNNKHQGILSIYLDQALRGNSISITGSPNRVRQLVHVEDVINALLIPLNGSETDNQVYNVLNEQSLSPQLIIDEISRILKKKLYIHELEGYIGDQTLITGTNSKITSLGWEPQYSLQQGIQEWVNLVN